MGREMTSAQRAALDTANRYRRINGSPRPKRIIGCPCGNPQDTGRQHSSLRCRKIAR
jgi:hypothetical protein